MKWILNKTVVIIGMTLLLYSCKEKSSPPPQRPRAVRFLEDFLTTETHTVIGADTNYYIIIAPEQCISCYAYSIVHLARFADAHHPFFIIALERQMEEVKKYIPDIPVRFISKYNPDRLKGQQFLRSGLAFAITANGQVHNVELINAETISKY